MNIYNDNETKYFWNKVTYLYFICSVMVVYLHSDNIEQYTIDINGGLGSTVFFIEKPLLQFVSGSAVPLFFFLSGFLFFRNFEFNKLIEKYKRRFRSLFIPYLSWNVIYTCIVIIFSYIPIIAMNIGNRWTMNPITINNIFKGIFLYQYNSVFWFIFQLILFILMTPIIYYAIKKLYIGAGVQVLLLFLCVNDTIHVPYLHLDMLLVYSLGGYLGLHNQKNIMERSTKLRSGIFVTAYLIFHLAVNYLSQTIQIQESFTEVISKLKMILGIFALFWGIDLIVLKEAKLYMKQTFFIYSLHLLVLSFYKKLFRFLLPDREWIALLMFLIIPCITIITILTMAQVLKKICNPIYNVLSGGRD